MASRQSKPNTESSIVVFESLSNSRRNDSARSLRRVAWTEREQLQFLQGFERFGLGRWKDIGIHFLPTRSSKQIKSHGQKMIAQQAAGIDVFAPLRRARLDGELPAVSDGPCFSIDLATATYQDCSQRVRCNTSDCLATLMTEGTCENQGALDAAQVLCELKRTMHTTTMTTT